MKPLSAAVAERSRKFATLALQKVQSVGQNQLAQQLQTSESTVSRFVSGDLEKACAVFAALGLKVVPCEMKCYPEDYIGAIFTLAKINMNQVASAEQLSFE